MDNLYGYSASAFILSRQKTIDHDLNPVILQFVRHIWEAHVFLIDPYNAQSNISSNKIYEKTCDIVPNVL